MIIRCITALCLVGISLAQDDLIAKTSKGSIQGYESASFDGTRVRIFKAIPFARPPVGDLRWKLPVEAQKWEGVKDGRKYAAACMSNSTTSSSPQNWVDEDCLYMNVFVHGECSEAKKCPIIVYFHGGGMNYDSATYFNDTALVETYASKGVMLVIPAFRLGFTGQFTVGDDGELIPSNLNMHDALFGLKFIRDEAAAFGGDKDDLTLMGHSFGGAMSILLGFSPLRKMQVPVQKLIVMSPGLSFDDPELNLRLSTEMIKRAGCTHAFKKVMLDCMMKKSGPELLAIQRTMEEEDHAAGDGALFGGILMRGPLFPFKSFPEMFTKAPKVDIMAGSTIGEMDFPETNTTVTRNSFGMYNGKFVGARNVEELDNLYYNLTTSGKNNQTHLPESQAIYLAVYLASRSIMQGGNKAYVYSFDQPTHHMHTDDLSHLMGIHLFEKDENEKEISQFYPQLFLNFTKYGTPSPRWKSMNLKDRYYSIAVDHETKRYPEMRDFYQQETIDFWLRKAPKIDKMITVTRAAGANLEWDKTKGGFRDLVLEDGEGERQKQNETLIPVLLVHTSYFPSFLLISAVFLLGVALGRYLLADSTSREERMWILGPDGRGIPVDKVPAYAEQMF
ncbi:hypothetical protein PFISCL1PPCAC_22506 [Pristionchus fissidentatus]|uniref:Carboxylesterase type B domain-containing protein n=1 Tax=Pristionchus fissidentatus TaxID=1538716 RepID=A0AAV5WN90_9BILA|nr:hypothetical protein PFISCL1PPCAC_22506 [Pristionchus fissidentatus]